MSSDRLPVVVGAVVVLGVAGLVGQRVELQQRECRRVDSRRRDLVVRERQSGVRIEQRHARAGEVACAPRRRRHDRIGLVQVSAEAAVVVEEERLAGFPLVDARDLEGSADVQREPLIEEAGLFARVRRERVRRRVEGRAGRGCRKPARGYGWRRRARQPSRGRPPDRRACRRRPRRRARRRDRPCRRHRGRPCRPARRRPAAAGRPPAAASLRESARHEPALLASRPGHTAGLALGAESSYPAEHALAAAPAAGPAFAHHHEEHRVDLAGCARRGHRIP